MNEPKEIAKDIQNTIDECNRIHKAMIGCEGLKKKELLDLISEWASFIHDFGVYRWSTLQNFMDVDKECREWGSDLESEVESLEERIEDIKQEHENYTAELLARIDDLKSQLDEAITL